MPLTVNIYLKYNLIYFILFNYLKYISLNFTVYADLMQSDCDTNSLIQKSSKRNTIQIKRNFLILS